MCIRDSYLKEGRPAFTYNFLGLESTTVMAKEPLEPGKYVLAYEFAYDGGGMGKGGMGSLSANGKKLIEGRLSRTQPGIFSVDDLADVGVDLGTSVADYGASSRFDGRIEMVTITVRE